MSLLRRDILKKPANDYGHLKHIRQAVDNALKHGKTEAYTIWY